MTPWIVACQASLSIGFPKQKYWSGLLFPSPGNFPNPGVKPTSPALAGRFFTTEPEGKSMFCDIFFVERLKPDWYFVLLSHVCP